MSAAPAPGLEEAVEAARRGLELATEATAAAFSSQSLSQIEAPLTAYHKFASRHFPIVANALLTRGDGRELGVPLGRDDRSDEHSRWLPIETAPKDDPGHFILGWCRQWTQPLLVRWLPRIGKWNTAFQPTHWMPLPSPPPEV